MADNKVTVGKRDVYEVGLLRLSFVLLSLFSRPRAGLATV